MKDPRDVSLGDLESTRTAEASDAPPRPGDPALRRGTSFDRYVILDRIGEGGMGVVYAAYDSSLDRKVALKFLHPDRAEPGAMREQRLVREAHAMARVSHPNVVVVYEVGSHEGRIFLAMEFVDGMDLRRWLAAEARSPAEIRRVFQDAGQGLAAAHAAGVTHRDFKPANVLVDARGRARVTDFGLSRVSHPLDGGLEREPNGANQEESAGGESSAPSPLSFPLTSTGAVLGTPSYMAPEQRGGGEADPRSDQFSFCVALYQALSGEHPFDAGGAAALEPGLRTGEGRPPRAPGSVPRWCRQALLRGLRPDPDQRFPSMDALLAELSNRPIRRRRRIAIGVALGLFVAGAAVYGLLVGRSSAAAPRCDLGAQRLAGVWDPARQRQTRAAFLAAGVPGVQTTWDRFASSLGQRAAAWARMYDSACVATHHDGVQSPAVLDLRVECLDRKLEEMKAVVDVYSHKLDKKALDRALEAADGLSPVSACAYVTNLRAVVPLPEDPAIRARVLDVRRRLSRAEALHDAGRFDEGHRVASELEHEAEGLRYPPLNAAVASAVGLFLMELGRGAEAEKALFEAIAQAVRGRDWTKEARAWVTLVATYGRLGRVSEGLLAGKVAEQAVERAQGDRVLRSRLFSTIANLELTAGRPARALDRFQRALRQLEAAHASSSSPHVAGVVGNIGLVLNVLGRSRESLPYLERALAARKASLRPDHPLMANSLAALGRGYHSLGMLRRGRDAIAAALDIQLQELGAQHRETMAMRTALAIAEANLGRHARALELVKETMSAQRRAARPDHGELAQTYIILGETHRLAGHHVQAERALERAIEHFERAGVPDHVSAGWALTFLGQVHNAERRHRRALRACGRGLAILKKTLPPNSAELMTTVICIGEARIGTGDVETARVQLERALGTFSERNSPPQLFAELRFHLARALWSTPAERTRARELAGAAVAALRAAEGDNRELIARVEAWLRKHPATK
jgi:eukaryotic-like serine/threonine-protein kinase